MRKQLLLAHLVCALLLWQTDAATRFPVKSIKPKPNNHTYSPSRDFIGDMCRLVDNSLQMVPWPLDIGGVCNSLGISDPANDATICPMLDLMRILLENLQSMYPMQCAPDGIAAPTSRDPAGRGWLLPTPLPNQLREGGLPARFWEDESYNLMQSEGPTHYWLFKNVMRFMAWAPCSALGVDQPWAQPEGWDLLALIDTAQDLSSYNIKQSSMPFAAVLRRASSAQTRASCRAFLQAHPAKAASRAARTQQRSRNMCAGDELVVLVRGTTTAYDWFYNLDFDMSTNAEYGPGGIHTGFLRLADSIWDGGLRNTLDQFSSSLGSVTIAGHSLGAATAALLAARAQRYLTYGSGRRVAQSAPQVTAVLFAAPNVGDATFTADYNSRVNTRNIAFSSDMVTQVPCVGSMVQCTGNAATAQGATGSGARAGNVTVKTLMYDRLGGRIDLVSERRAMPVQQEAWSLLSTYTQDDFCDNMYSLANLIEATHICSYMCALSGTNPETSGDWCLLWPEEGFKQQQSGATYCMSGFSFISEQDFPTSPTFPSRKDPQWLRQQVMRKGARHVAKTPKDNGAVRGK